jgi:hypothetical protein
MRSLAELIEPFRVEISQAALDAERRQAMSYSISTLLTRNLHVFGENDPARRRAAIDEIFTEACRAEENSESDREHVAEKLQRRLPKFNQFSQNGVFGRDTP